MRPLMKKNADAQTFSINDDFYREIVESTEDAIIGKDLKATVKSWNRGAEKIYGYKKDEIIGKPLTTLMPHEKEDELEKIMEQVKQGKTIKHFETLRKHKNGNLLNMSVTISPIKNSDGEIIGASSIGRNITEKKRLEKNLAYLSEASKKLTSSLDYKATLRNIARLAVPKIGDWFAIHIKEDEGLLSQLAIAHTNPKKIKWAKELNKKYPTDPDSPYGTYHVLRTGKPELYSTITEDLLAKSAKNKEHLHILKEVGFKSAMVVPLLVHKKAIGTISFVTSESEYHYTKADLKFAEELANRAAIAIENARLYMEAQKSLSLRDEFISVASHELKTPLTSMKMYMQGLEIQAKKKNLEKIPEYASKIYTQIDKLNLLVSDMLNVSRLQHGKLEFNFEKFYIEDQIKEVIDTVKPIAKKHKIIVRGKISKKVYADQYRIQQVITNLLTNAIKYSPNSDKVIINLSEEKDHATVEVQDFGIGIEKEHLNKLFTQFYRVTNREDSYPGLGMGLYISHEIIKRHAGSINVMSKKGEGSTFSFTIPYDTRV